MFFTNTWNYSQVLESSSVGSEDNNAIFSEPRKILPILKTDEPICPEGKLACGSGDCIEKELFCNGKPDCKDESDENACSKIYFVMTLWWFLR